MHIVKHKRSFVKMHAYIRSRHFTSCVINIYNVYSYVKSSAFVRKQFLKCKVRKLDHTTQVNSPHWRNKGCLYERKFNYWSMHLYDFTFAVSVRRMSVIIITFFPRLCLVIYFLAELNGLNCPMKDSWQHQINNYRNTLSLSILMFSPLCCTLLYMTDVFWLLHTLTAHFNLFFSFFCFCFFHAKENKKILFRQLVYRKTSPIQHWSVTIIPQFCKLSSRCPQKRNSTCSNMVCTTFLTCGFWISLQRHVDKVFTSCGHKKCLTSQTRR